MRDILIIGNDLMDHRITIHQGHRITINQDGKEETIQLCREFPKYGLQIQKYEEIGPQTAKLVICKCGLTDQNGNIPDKVLLTGDTSDGLYIPRLVTEVIDETIYAVIENHSDEVYQLYPGKEIGEILPLQETFIGKQRVYETPESSEGMHFLHDDVLREHILLGNDDSVLPIPHGYEEPDKDTKEIDIENIKTDGLDENEVIKLKQILKRFEGVFSTGPGDFGKTPLMSFRIETGDAEPYAARYYPIPIGYRDVVKKQLKEMKKNGIVEDANSPWSSNLVILKKPNGKL